MFSRRIHRSGKVATTLVLAAAAIVAGAGGALADFTATATGPAATRASHLPAGRRPMAELNVTVTGNTVAVTWPPVTLPSGNDVGGYVVRRTVVATPNVVTPVCTTVVPITSCTDDTPPAGTEVTYTVTPQAQSWSGPTSPPSAPVVLP